MIILRTETSDCLDGDYSGTRTNRLLITMVLSYIIEEIEDYDLLSFIDSVVGRLAVGAVLAVRYIFGSPTRSRISIGTPQYVGL